MFTQGTKSFGVWRAGHPSLDRHSGRPTQAILLAYGFCAFLTWFIFILTLKIRGDFFLIESMNLPLHSVSDGELQPSRPRPVGLSVAVRDIGVANTFRVIFDTGESFVFPQDKNLVNNFLERRADQMELSAMLRKSASPRLSTAVLWVDRLVPLQQVQPLAKTLVQVGFDNLSYAVAAGRSEKSGGH